MNPITMLVVFAACLALAFIAARRVRQRPSTMSEAMRSMAVNLQAVAGLIGNKLIPVMRTAVQAVVDFEQEWVRAVTVTTRGQGPR
jgi:hypothetical protein